MLSPSISNFWGNWKDAFFFMLKIALVYGSWRVLKHLGEADPDFLFGAWEGMYDFIAKRLAEATSVILTLLGYSHKQYGRVVIPDGARGIIIANLCVGVAAFYIYTGLIIAFGTNWRDKLWFIPLGLLLIFIINIFRVLALVLVQLHYEQFFKLAHTYVYVVITYGLIFALVVFWMEKLAFKNAKQAMQ